MSQQKLVVFGAVMAALAVLSAPVFGECAVIEDAMGRNVEIPDRVERVICSGPGCLRLLTYLRAQDLAVAVDDMEKRRPEFDARPYALANPQFKKLPVFGEFRGHDHPELILALSPMPQVIFKTHAHMGHDPVELQNKTGIPVVVLNYGDLGANREQLFQALRIMGGTVDREQRAEEVISFFTNHIEELADRTGNIPDGEKPRCFVGGVASKGPHGYQSTEPGYPPFAFVGAKNLAYDPSKGKKALRHANIAKEKIVEWDPDILFLDLSTIQLGNDAGGLYELRTDPAYRSLSAVRAGRVYGLLPYNWYTRNFGSILANAWYVGKLLYPERFPDVDPAGKADEIYTFLVGKPVFKEMNKAFHGLVFRPVLGKQAGDDAF
ncbi:MAG: iron ABC transporter substrate-binding protein [Desulfatibacillaceae bacterium]